MAFVATRSDETKFGNKRVTFGTFTNDGSSGTIATGLAKCEYAHVTGASVLTQSSGTLTATTSATSGFWMAFGSD